MEENEGITITEFDPIEECVNFLMRRGPLASGGILPDSAGESIQIESNDILAAGLAGIVMGLHTIGTSLSRLADQAEKKKAKQKG